jgi:anthranilate synthase component 1
MPLNLSLEKQNVELSVSQTVSATLTQKLPTSGSDRSASHGTSLSEHCPVVAALEAALDAETLERGDCEVPYRSGLFGWLFYDIARELEDLPRTTADDREAAWQEP